MVTCHRNSTAVGADAAHLSRGELAVFLVILWHANSETGLAWPSFKTLARECKLTVRATKKIVPALAKKGLIRIARHGNRTTSNRYLVNFSIMGVVNAGSLPVVNGGSPEPFYRTQALTWEKDRMELNVEKAEAALGPGGSSVPASPTGGESEFSDRYPEFWAAFPVRGDVHRTETLLAEMVERGANLQEILGGANRYGEYVRAVPKMRMTPIKWLEGQHWRDGWTFAPKTAKGADTRAPAQPKAQAKGSAKVANAAQAPESATNPVVYGFDLTEADKTADMARQRSARKKEETQQRYDAEKDRRFKPWPVELVVESVAAFFKDRPWKDPTIYFERRNRPGNGRNRFNDPLVQWKLPDD